jgi:hypothetical protein
LKLSCNNNYIKKIYKNYFSHFFFFAATFADNPQFGALIQVDGAVHHLDADGRTTLITAVLQKYRRELRCRGLDDLPIGFAVYAIDGDCGGGDHG